MTLKVGIADDQALVRAGFRMVLEKVPDIEVVGEAENGIDAIELARKSRPDVLLMDIRMPEMDGIEATRRILKADSPPRILVLTTFDLDDYVYDALKAGASGFLLKDIEPERLVAAIRSVSDGEALLAPAVTRRLIEEYTQRRPAEPSAIPQLDQLSPRELEVLQLVAKGMSNHEIAEHLVVGESTVKTHVARLLSKLGLRDRVQAVVFCYEHELIKPGEN